jgi:tetratricopeptide (TPR) repeat protein
MFNSRNIHFAILGIILGASSGYILAFYQVQKSMPPPPPPSAAAQGGHADVSTEELLAMFQEAMRKSPNNPELLTRYGLFLSRLGRRAEAQQVLKQVESIDPAYAGLDSLKKELAAERGTTVQ